MTEQSSLGILKKKEKLKVFEHTAAINSFVISACNKYLVSGDTTGTVYLWDVDKGVVLVSLEGDPSELVRSIDLDKNNETVLIALSGRGKTSPSALRCYAFEPLVALGGLGGENKSDKNSDKETSLSSIEKENNSNNNNNYYNLKNTNDNNFNNNNFNYNNINNFNNFDNNGNNQISNNIDGKKNDGLLNFYPESKTNSNNSNTNESIYNNNSIYNNQNKNKKKNKDGKVDPIVFHVPKKVQISSLETSKEIKLTSSKYLKAVFLDGKKSILAGREDGFLQLLNYETSEVILEKKIHSESILDFDVSEERRMVLTSSADGYAYVLGLDYFNQVFKFHPENPTRNLYACKLMLVDNPFAIKKKFNLDYVFSKAFDRVEDPYTSLRNEPKLPIAVFTGGQDSKLVTTTHKKEGGFEIVVHELIDGAQLLYFASHFGPVNALGCVKDKALLASGSEDATVRLYNLYDYLKDLDNW